MAKCIVFGGDGFVGSRLVTELLLKGHNVSVFGRREGIGEINQDVNYIYGDFLNKADVSGAVRGQEYVFHFTTLTNPAVSNNDPYIDIETNVKMTIGLLESCVDNGVKRIIFPSSGGSIYGDNGREVSSEDDPTMPVSPYAIGKQSIEGYLRFFDQKHDLDYLVLRISNVYGPGQRTTGSKHGVISVFMDSMLKGKPVNVYGDGSMVRDYVYVDDLAALIADMSFKETNYKTYNVGSSEGVTVSEIIRELETVLQIKTEKLYLEAPSTYVSKIVLDCSRIKDEFGVFSKTTLRQGMIKLSRKLEKEKLR
jgi:UDP-glucose 4-epimerase